MNMFVSRHDPFAFSEKVLLALETELVQEKVFSTVVKPFFELAIKSLGSDVGNRLDRLATSLDDKFKVFREELDSKVKLQRVVHGGEDVIEYVPDELSQSEEATATAREATNSPVKSAKNAGRKARRKRCNAKMSYTRASLLQLRPIVFQHRMRCNDVDANPGPPLVPEAILGRLDHLEIVVGSWCPLAEPAGWSAPQRAIPAEFLASQCEAVRRIQRAWRLHSSVPVVHDVATLLRVDELNRNTKMYDNDDFWKRMEGYTDVVPPQSWCMFDSSPASSSENRADFRSISTGSLNQEVETSSRQIPSSRRFAIRVQYSCSSELAADDLAGHFRRFGEVGDIDWTEDAEEGTCQEARVFFCDPASRVEAMQQRHQIQRGADGIRFPAKVYVNYCDNEVCCVACVMVIFRYFPY